MFKSESVDFSFLDSESLRPFYGYGQKLSQMAFYIGGIKCARCVNTLESLPEKVPGLLDLRVDLGQKVARIEVDRSRIPFSEVAKAIEAVGFHPVPLAAEDESQKLRQLERRSNLVRLAIAGALAGNIMSFSFANYFGTTGEWRVLFNWLSFALYLPVVTYVASPFYRGAYHAIKNRRISIDLPMAIASLAGFIFSTVEWLRGHDDFYFDSMASFLFLILLSRSIQSYLQDQFLKSDDMGEDLSLLKVRRVTKEGFEWIARHDLKAEDRFEIHAGETLPVDAQLDSPFAHVSLAFLNGEGKPRTYHRAGEIPAGAKFISGPHRLKFLRPLENTTFGRLLKGSQSTDWSQSKAIQQSDIWAERLLISVFSVAFLFLIFYWFISPEEAIRRSLALIVLACPCAMAFGTPLALSAALKKARKLGLLIRDGSVFETLADTKTIFIDKTGTLTETDLELVESPSAIPWNEKEIILSLESRSAHPMAFAFRKALAQTGAPWAVTNYSETPGFGVRAEVQGHTYELTRSPEAAFETTCTLKKDGETLRHFHFRSTAKPSALKALSSLRQKGLNVILLSGDNPEPTQQIGAELQFQQHEIFGGLSPEEKAQHVKRSRNSVMVGDGLNDTLAFSEANVSIAVTGGSDGQFKNAKVLMIHSDLSALPQLLKLAHKTRSALKLNLQFAAFYNVAVGTSALLGFINPYMAALLMPLSSGVILLMTWIGAKT